MLLTLISCSSVTIRTDGGEENTQAPNVEQQYTYWWWGLQNSYEINVRESCKGQDVEQMQAVYTITDSLSGLFTLGIYSPRTARIWCQELEI